MIIKRADDQSDNVAALSRLLEEAASVRQRRRIAEEIENITDGIKGEAETAFHLDALLGGKGDFAIIHDLVLQIDGSYAQIDHLVLTRKRQVFVLETKAIRGTLECDDEGKWLACYGKSEFPIASPVEQARRHVEIVRRWLAATGSSMRQVIPAVVVTPKTIVKKTQAELRMDIVGSDLLATWIRRKTMDADDITIEITVPDANREEIIGAAYLMAAAHSPQKQDWRRRMGMVTENVIPSQLNIDGDSVFIPIERKNSARKEAEIADDKKTSNAKITEVEIYEGKIQVFTRSDGRTALKWMGATGQGRFHSACKSRKGVYNDKGYWTLSAATADAVIDELKKAPTPDATFFDITPEALSEIEVKAIKDSKKKSIMIITPYGQVEARLTIGDHRALRHHHNDLLATHIKAICEGRAKWRDEYSNWLVAPAHFDAVRCDLENRRDARLAS